MIHFVLNELLRDIGFGLVDVQSCDTTAGVIIGFTCAANQRYSFHVMDNIVTGSDPYGGQMRKWDLNDPTSLDNMEKWARDLRNHWRLCKTLIDKLPVKYMGNHNEEG